MVTELDESRLVTLYAPADEAEFVVFASLLDEQGIEYLTKNKHIQNLFGAGQSITGYNLVTGEQTIMVHEDDFPAAKEILDSFKLNNTLSVQAGDQVKESQTDDDELIAKYNRYLNHSLILNFFLPFIGFFLFFKALMMKILYPFRGLKGNIRLVISFLLMFLWVFVFFTLVFD
ncbi:MAG: hypothetical protein SCALA702_10720 [Melioribacteraceae bacterium]|nr:MAG: hypothetical protein SCALA702_10720 [Melioribacteraceae bacterium]